MGALTWRQGTSAYYEQADDARYTVDLTYHSIGSRYTAWFKPGPREAAQRLAPSRVTADEAKADAEAHLAVQHSIAEGAHEI